MMNLLLWKAQMTFRLQNANPFPCSYRTFYFSNIWQEGFILSLSKHIFPLPFRHFIHTPTWLDSHCLFFMTSLELLNVVAWDVFIFPIYKLCLRNSTYFMDIRCYIQPYKCKSSLRWIFAAWTLLSTSSQYLCTLIPNRHINFICLNHDSLLLCSAPPHSLTHLPCCSLSLP